MTTTAHERPIPAASAAYLAAVDAALVGVPDSDRQELLDDLAEHLRELAPEHETDLIERLGAPELYAAELLASAGIEPAARTDGARLKLVALRRTIAARFDSPSGRTTRAFWRELRPAWWVLRGWLVPAVIAARLDGDSSRSGVLNALWIPRPTHHVLIDLALLAAAIAASIRIGRANAASETPGRKWVSGLATALGVLALVGVVSAQRATAYEVSQTSYDTPTPDALIGPTGNYITNVFAYDASGKWLGPVFLFDQDGAPLTTGNAMDLQNSGVPFVSGLFPQPVLSGDDYGNTQATTPSPPAVRIPTIPQSPTDNGAATTTVPAVATPKRPVTGNRAPTTLGAGTGAALP